MQVGPRMLYHSPSRLVAGNGARLELGREMHRLAARRVFVITSPSVARHQKMREDVQHQLQGRHVQWFTDVKPDSPLSSVESAVAMARPFKPDGIVAIGGGSAMVTARAVLILLAEKADLNDLVTQYPSGMPPISPRLDNPKIPHVAIPTTPTFAAMASGVAILDPNARRRLELYDPKCRPTAVLWDPEALATAPLNRVRNAAVATFCIALSLFESSQMNVLAQADLREAVRMFKLHWPTVLSENETRRYEEWPLALAAILVGRARDARIGTGNGLAMGLAHQLHVELGMDMTRALVALLPVTMTFNRPDALDGQTQIADLLGERSKEGDGGPLSAAEIVAHLFRQSGYSTRLRDCGLSASQIPAVAKAAWGDYFVRSNVRPITDSAQLVTLLEQAW